MDGSFTLVDDATGSGEPLPVKDGVLLATDIAGAFRGLGHPRPVVYDPGFAGTAAFRSAITVVDGDAGLLYHRGRAITDLARDSDFLTLAYLLLHGEPPDAPARDQWTAALSVAAGEAMPVLATLDGVPGGGHPMHQLMAAVATLAGAGFEPSTRAMDDDAVLAACTALVAQVPVAAAVVYQRSAGRQRVDWDPDSDLMANVTRMLVGSGGLPLNLARDVLDTLFLLHADHEQNCGTSVVRSIASAGAGPYTAVVGAIGALHGPRHGGAAEAVLRMLRDIGDPSRVESYLAGVKRRERRLAGFGSRAYRTYDSRVALERELADCVFAFTRPPAEFAVARELERQAVGDEFFASRRLFPNVDLYSGLIYQALGLPPEMLPVVFAAARTSGWVAHWYEACHDDEARLVRPAQVHIGPRPGITRHGTARNEHEDDGGDDAR